MVQGAVSIVSRSVAGVLYIGQPRSRRVKSMGWIYEAPDDADQRRKTDRQYKDLSQQN